MNAQNCDFARNASKFVENEGICDELLNLNGNSYEAYMHVIVRELVEL